MASHDNIDAGSPASGEIIAEEGTGSAGSATADPASGVDIQSPPSFDEDSLDSDSYYDSAIGDMSAQTSTQSLRSSIYENVEENGRTYHRYKDGKYLFPNDEEEQQRLEVQHALYGVTFRGKLYLAPIGNQVHNVLDVATGTGSWAIEFAQQHPESNVLGTDLSAIQPLYVPPNCRFEIDDAEDQWIFESKFDFIHGRTLLTLFKDPKRVLIQQAFDALSPGGYLELQDAAFPFQYASQDPPVDSALYKWANFAIEGGIKRERPWTTVVKYAQWMGEVGFEEIVEMNFYWPTNHWAKGQYMREVAMYYQRDLIDGLEGISLRIMETIGWSAEQTKEFLVDVKRDIRDPNIRAYMPVKVVYGRKPAKPS